LGKMEERCGSTVSPAEAVILESTAHGSFQKRVRLFYHGLDHRSLIQTE
jgi:hypothetical protein